MNAGQRVRVKRYPHLIGTVERGTYLKTFKGLNVHGEEEVHTPLDPRVDIKWDYELGTPEKTTIREDLVEVLA